MLACKWDVHKKVIASRHIALEFTGALKGRTWEYHLLRAKHGGQYRWESHYAAPVWLAQISVERGTPTGGALRGGVTGRHTRSTTLLHLNFVYFNPSRTRWEEVRTRVSTYCVLVGRHRPGIAHLIIQENAGYRVTVLAFSTYKCSVAQTITVTSAGKSSFLPSVRHASHRKPIGQNHGSSRGECCFWIGM
jgi:hypothetical protein